MIGDIVGGVFGKQQPQAPAAPDYTGAAVAQGAANVDAARVTGRLNRPDEYTPFGSRTWSDLGNDRFRLDTNFTPLGQQTFDKAQGIQSGMMDQAGTSLAQTRGALSSPFDISNNRNAIVDAMYRRSTRLMDPSYAQNEERTKNELINKGFSVGDEGYTRAMDNFTRNKDEDYANARDRATTSGAQQAVTEALIQRQQPLTELNALRTGAMPTTPQFQNYANTGPVSPAPLMAGAQAQGNYGMQNYGIQSGNYNNMMSGLASLGSAWLGA